ncbi:UNVERIFIED_CONTAM: hypothetical protein Scaly_1988800 [Sesamum calycinum]|uniref:Uncharacterized protein n=1 Tax=Sesamum calycinum TaxID=2727403 RepID=A0AAW2N2W6_9LAMI
MWSGAAVAKTASKLLCQTRVEGLTYKDADVDIDEENNQDGFPNWRFWRALAFEYGDIHLVADTDEVETKLETGSHQNIGLDWAAISVNDIVHSRAKSFFFQILVLIEIFQSVCNLWIGLSFLSCTLVSKSFGFDRQLGVYYFRSTDSHLVADTDEVETKLETGSHQTIGLELFYRNAKYKEK